MGRMPRRPATAIPDRPLPGTELEAPRPSVALPAQLAPEAPVAHEAPSPADSPREPVNQPRTSVGHRPEPHQRPVAAPPAAAAPAAAAPVPMPHRPNGNGIHPTSEPDEGSLERGATAPQLRRFIKSRAYVPLHELRRRFAINSADDDVTPVDLERRRVFVGLPEREGRLLGELLRGGDIGFELSLDPITPIVVGVYPMRPVTRT
jgi:hypothetical protein